MANFGLIGSPLQINVTAGAFFFEGSTVQSGADWVFYVSTTAWGASGLTGNVIASEISASGVPSGGEIDLAVPSALSGYLISGPLSAVLADGSFIVSYGENISGPSPTYAADVVHYSATGTVLGSFLVNAWATPIALANGGFALSEIAFGGSNATTAVLATYAETGVTPLSTITGATATAAGEEIALRQLETSAGMVTEQDFIDQAAGQTSGLDVTLPGATTPLVFSAPAANSATTTYYLVPSNIVAAPDGSFYLAVTTNTINASSGATSSQINIYHIVSGSPQLLTTINGGSTNNTFSAAESIALLSNGDIAVEYSGALQTTGFTGAQQYVALLSPTGMQIDSTVSLGVGSGGLTPLSNGNLATQIENSTGLFAEQLGFGAPALGLIGSAQQINVTAGAYTIEGFTTQNGAGWVFYAPTASGLTGNLIAREISTSGVAIGGEIDLAIPAAQSGYTITSALSAVLTDGSFIVAYDEYDASNSSTPYETNVVHYSATGGLLGSFLVNTEAFPAMALANGGFVLAEAGMSGTAETNAVLATYAETGTTPSSTTTVAAATAGEQIFPFEFNTSAGIVSVTDEPVTGVGQTSSLQITLPGATTPLVFSAPAANSTNTRYGMTGSNVVAAPDGSFYVAVTTDTFTSGSAGQSVQINLYHIVSGAPQLLTTINEGATNNIFAPGAESIALLSNGDIAVEYSGNVTTTGGAPTGAQQYVALFSPTGTQIGSTASLGVGSAGLTPLSNGNIATTVATSTGLFTEQLGFGAPTLGSIGSPLQINVTAGAYTIEGYTTQNGAGWVFYAPTASGLTGNLIAREISASGVPTGGEIALAIPAAQSGYSIMDAQSAVLTDGSFIVGYQEFNSAVTGGSWETDVEHYSATGTLLDSFLVNTSAFPTALASGGFQLGELGFGGTSMPSNAVLATYAANGTTPSSSTTVATATALGESISITQVNTSAGIVNEQTNFMFTNAALTSSVDITLPGATTPLGFSAPAANSASTTYSVWASKIAAAPDGSFYLAVTTDTTSTSANTTSAQINIYHILSGAPQLLTTINENALNNQFAGQVANIALLSNGDIAVEYSGASQSTTGFVGAAQQYVALVSPTGTQIGSTISLGLGPVGADALTPLSNGNLATIVETSNGLFVEQLSFGAQPADNFDGDGKSDLLLENASGAVVVGAVQNGAESYTQVAALGSEWSFKGNGDFLGDGKTDFLIENTSGAIAVGEVSNGTTNYTQVAALGSEWKFVGTGDFLGDGQKQFLIENTSGAVVTGNVVNGQAQYTPVAALGPEWSFEGAGNFLGDGKTDFLIENASGAIDVGEVSNGTTSYAPVAALGSEWKFVGTGDFLGAGQDQFLIENSSGAIDVANVVNGQAQYTQVAALGPEWSFIGTGDYLGTGTAGFMIENTAGAVALGTIANGQASYAQVGALGPEWTSHS